MPVAKHKRHGRHRPRDNLKVSAQQRQPLTKLEKAQRWEAAQSIGTIMRRLIDLHGEREWTVAEWTEATEQLLDEGLIRDPR